jgi:hypothetical protein
MKIYEAAGLHRYDFGGAGAPASVTQFKLSFGGELSTSKYFCYAGTGRIVWKLAHSLYESWYDRRLKSIPARRRSHALDFAIR